MWEITRNDEWIQKCSSKYRILHFKLNYVIGFVSKTLFAQLHVWLMKCYTKATTESLFTSNRKCELCASFIIDFFSLQTKLYVLSVERHSRFFSPVIQWRSQHDCIEGSLFKTYTIYILCKLKKRRSELNRKLHKINEKKKKKPNLFFCSR